MELFPSTRFLSARTCCGRRIRGSLSISRGARSSRGMLAAAPRPCPQKSQMTPSPLVGSTIIVVNDRDIEHFVLQLREGARVSGRVTFEGAVRPEASLVTSRFARGRGGSPVAVSRAWRQRPTTRSAGRKTVGRLFASSREMPRSPVVTLGAKRARGPSTLRSCVWRRAR